MRHTPARLAVAALLLAVAMPVTAQINISEGKAAFSSSLYGFGLNPDQAVDGDLLADHPTNPYFASARQVNPWWYVDLGAIMTIDEVRVYGYNGGEICGFSGCANGSAMRVSILDVFDAAIDATSSWSSDVADATLSPFFFDAGGASGRYVKVQLLNTPEVPRHLALAEVQVFQDEVVDPPPTTVPEPVSMMLVATGLGGVAAARRRRRAAQQ